MLKLFFFSFKDLLLKKIPKILQLGESFMELIIGRVKKRNNLVNKRNCRQIKSLDINLCTYSVENFPNVVKLNCFQHCSLGNLPAANCR